MSGSSTSESLLTASIASLDIDTANRVFSNRSLLGELLDGLPSALADAGVARAGARFEARFGEDAVPNRPAASEGGQPGTLARAPSVPMVPASEPSGLVMAAAAPAVAPAASAASTLIAGASARGGAPSEGATPTFSILMDGGDPGWENNPPFADDDLYEIVHDTTLTVSAPGVLSNDWDDDEDPLSAILDSDPTVGTLDYFNSDGSFEYVPPSDWSGIATFTYHATDGIDTSDVVTVQIEVTNSPPQVDDDLYQVLHDTTLTELAPGVLSNDWDDDGDPLTAMLDSGPAAGTLDFNSDGSFEYVPPEQWAGTVTFTYSATDGIDTSSLATVSIEVTDTAPSATPDEHGMLRDTSLTIDAPGVLANDSDADGDPLTAQLDTSPSNGSLMLNGDGSFEYEPNSGWTGSDSFTYYVTDGVVGPTGSLVRSASTTVTIEVGRIVIKRDDEPITEANDTLIVGQRVNLTAELGLTVFSQQIQSVNWMIDGQIVEAYAQTLEQGAVNPMDAEDFDDWSIQFYWINGGEKTVQFFVTTGTQSVGFSETLEVLRPTATLTSTITPLEPPTDIRDGFMRFGGLDPGTGGIRWHAEVTTPAGGAGSIAFTQLVKTDSRTTLDNGTHWKFTSEDAEGNLILVLDDPVPYGERTAAIGSSDTQTHTDSDSPGLDLAGARNVSADDKFELYLMYRPDGSESIWVTLRLLEWHWKAAATKTNNVWAMDPGQFPEDDSDPPTSSDSTKLPVWGPDPPNRFTTIEWVQVNG